MERDFSLFEHVKKRGIGSNLSTRYLSLKVFPRAGEVEKEKVARQVVRRGVFLRTRAEKEYVENVAWSRSVYLLQLVWIVWELSARVCFTVVVDRVTCLPYYPADLSSTWVHFTGEPIGAVGANRSDGHRVKLFEESVTFIAQLHPEVNKKKVVLRSMIGIVTGCLWRSQDHAAMVPPLDRTWMIGNWPVHEYQIPIIVGISSGVLILLLLIAVLVAWRCCYIHRSIRDKAFGIHQCVCSVLLHARPH